MLTFITDCVIPGFGLEELIEVCSFSFQPKFLKDCCHALIFESSSSNLREGTKSGYLPGKENSVKDCKVLPRIQNIIICMLIL